MAGSGVDAPKQPTSQHRPRHQITRSITEISSPIRLGRNHPHGHHPSNHHRKERDHDDGLAVPQSAAPVLQGSAPATARTSLDVPRYDGVTPALTPDQSRRASVLISSLDAAAALPQKQPGEEELRREQERALARADGLRKSLADLCASSAATTRRLDGSYYGVLEKLSSLQGTVLALRELAGTARDAAGVFGGDARALAADAHAQLDGFGDFDAQERRVAALQARIGAGRGRVERLSARVDAVRDRVEGWGRADRAWQERTRRRLKTMWLVTSAALLALLLLFVAARMAASEGALGATTASSTASSTTRSSSAGDGAGLPEEVAAAAAPTVAGTRKGAAGNGTATAATAADRSSWDDGGGGAAVKATQRLMESLDRVRPGGEEPEGLRVFDEL